MAQAMRAILLASAIAATLVGRRANSLVSQGRCLAPWIFAYRITASAPAVNRLRRDRSPRLVMLPSLSSPAFGQPAEPLLAAARILLRNQADPGRKVSSRSKSSRIGNARDQRRSQRRSHAGDLIKPFARLIGSMPGQDAPIELQDLCLEHPQLRAKGGKTLTCDLWHPLVIRIGDDVEELLDTVAANRRDDPELGEVGADRIDHRGLLANEEMTCAMEHEAALLRGRLGFHEAHARTQ